MAQGRSACCACEELLTVIEKADSQHQAVEPAGAAGSAGLHNVIVEA